MLLGKPYSVLPAEPRIAGFRREERPKSDRFFQVRTEMAVFLPDPFDSPPLRSGRPNGSCCNPTCRKGI